MTRLWVFAMRIRRVVRTAFRNVGDNRSTIETQFVTRLSPSTGGDSLGTRRFAMLLRQLKSVNGLFRVRNGSSFDSILNTLTFSGHLAAVEHAPTGVGVSSLGRMSTTELASIESLLRLAMVSGHDHRVSASRVIPFAFIHGSILGFTFC